MDYYLERTKFLGREILQRNRTTSTYRMLLCRLHRHRFSLIQFGAMYMMGRPDDLQRIFFPKQTPSISTIYRAAVKTICNAAMAIDLPRGLLSSSEQGKQTEKEVHLRTKRKFLVTEQGLSAVKLIGRLAEKWAYSSEKKLETLCLRAEPDRRLYQGWSNVQLVPGRVSYHLPWRARVLLHGIEIGRRRKLILLLGE